VVFFRKFGGFFSKKLVGKMDFKHGVLFFNTMYFLKNKMYFLKTRCIFLLNTMVGTFLFFWNKQIFPSIEFSVTFTCILFHFFIVVEDSLIMIKDFGLSVPRLWNVLQFFCASNLSAFSRQTLGSFSIKVFRNVEWWL